MTSAPDDRALIDGRYRLGRQLGSGGSAVVRLARDERLNRDVAIKLFHAGSADTSRQSGEVALMAGFTHPALVRLYDGGTSTDADGAEFTYLAMEFVDGQTLNTALDGGALPPGRVGAIGADLAGALDYLHRRGIVHRDVKPANILLPVEDDVAAKLSDFGVARILADSRLTAVGFTVGTANYLSPEQVRGDDVGPASDVYALGLVLIEALTGLIVYEGVGVAAATSRLHRAPVVPAQLGPAWGGLLAAMVADDPTVRPAAAEVRQRLAELARFSANDVPTELLGAADSRTAVIGPPVLGGQPMLAAATQALPTTPGREDRERRRRRGRAAAIIGVAAAVLIAVGAGVLLADSDTPAPAAPQSTSPSAPGSSAAARSRSAAAAAASASAAAASAASASASASASEASAAAARSRSAAAKASSANKTKEKGDNGKGGPGNGNGPGAGPGGGPGAGPGGGPGK